MSIQDPPQAHWLLRRSHNFVAILCKILTQTKSHRHYFKYFSGNFQTVDHNWQLWLTFYDNSLRVKPQNQRCLHFFYLKKFLHTKYIYIIFSSDRIILYIRTAKRENIEKYTQAAEMYAMNFIDSSENCHIYFLGMLRINLITTYIF